MPACSHVVGPRRPRVARTGLAMLALAAAGCVGPLPPSWLLVTGVTGHEAVVTGTGAAPTTVTCQAASGHTAQATITGPHADVWRARLTALVPDTAYVCRVARASPRTVAFRTPGGPNTPAIFAVVGDSGDDSPEATVLAHRMARNPPDFLLHVGDLAYPSATAPALDRRFFRVYRSLLRQTVFFATPGNHDIATASAFRPIFAQDSLPHSPSGAQYSFGWGPAHVVSISSRELIDEPEAERQWIAADLAQARDRPWRIAFLHDPLYSPGSKRSARGLRRMLVPILEAGRVDLVLVGHEHLYARADASCVHDPDARLVQIVSGGGSADLDPAAPHPYFPRTASRTQYLRVRVTPRSIDGKAIDLEGRVIDRFRLRRDRPGPCRRDGWPPSRA